MSNRDLLKVNIRPGVAILSVLRHLNYRPWFAMAEFVDNSLQSGLDNKKALLQTDGANYQLKVEITFDPTDGGRITIRDNAAGIREKDYPRAFRPAAIPPDRTGLAEFGIGMKSAACWFASAWSVRTSALGEPVERLVKFDIQDIVQDSLEELSVKSKPIKETAHFTEIVLERLHKAPHGKTVQKVRDHLASIFRVFIRDGTLKLVFDGEVLDYEEPKILQAPYYKAPSGPSVSWKKEINFDLGGGLKVHGSAAIREKASTSFAGFALFRRNRLIEGSGDEGYRPEAIFGKSNSFTYQRLFGELHLDGFEVSHTKDGFKWDENEEPFLELLKEHLDKEPVPLLKQAEEHRVGRKTPELKPAADQAAAKTAQAIEQEVPPVIKEQIKASPEATPPPHNLSRSGDIVSSKEINVRIGNTPWNIRLELTNDPAIGDWLEISDRGEQSRSGEPRKLGLRMSLAHPFMERFVGADPGLIEPFFRIAAAIALAEIAARESGVRQAGTIRRNVNDLLRNALAKP